MRFLLALGILLFVTLLSGTRAHLYAQSGATSSPPTQAHDDGAVVYVSMVEGSVDSAELFHAVSGELHWVAGSITAFSRAFQVESPEGQRIPAERVAGLVQNYPTVFSFRDDPQTKVLSLAVDVNELAALLSDKKSALRKWLAEIQNRPLAELSKVQATWKTQQGNPSRIVVTIAGLHSIESSAQAVALQVHRRTNLPACVFRYPNDAPVAESAGLLVLHLQDLHRQYPDSKITLIAHSMGGLVSRGALELEAYRGLGRSSVAARTGVDQLIQVCPPNHGSALAPYAPLLEGAEQLSRIVNRRTDQRSRVLFRSIVDGFNEASADLDPQSDFLTRLNACVRNPAVRYTVLAGNDGPLGSGMSNLLATVWDRIATSVDEPANLDRRIREVLTCEELLRGKGDGVVSVQSARLDGVDDWELLEMHHLVWNELDSDAGRTMLLEVARRIGIAL